MDRRTWKQKFIVALGGRCVNCQTTANLQFDHVVPEEKSFNITTRIPTYSWNTLVEELQKCQLLCGPCHAVKSVTDRGDKISDHGTISHYNNKKCKCERCRKAWADHVRTRRKALSVL